MRLFRSVAMDGEARNSAAKHDMEVMQACPNGDGLERKKPTMLIGSPARRGPQNPPAISSAVMDTVCANTYIIPGASHLPPLSTEKCA